MKKTLTLLLVLSLLLSLLAGCGNGTTTSSASPSASELPQSANETPAAPETPDTKSDSTQEASQVEEGTMAGDYTASNASLDFEPWRDMLKTKTMSLPITEEPETLSYFLGFESNSLNYIEGGNLENQQVWKWLEENSGVDLDLTVVDRASLSDKFNLMVGSGDYTDIMNISEYTAGVEAAWDEEVIIDLGDYLETEMPNYWSIINADQNLLRDVKEGDNFLAIYPIKDQVANPADMGAFIRMDWLEDLELEVPTTYDELTDVLRAFKTEKEASEPMALYNTISMAHGLLMGGFGSMAELSTNGLATGPLNAYYQIDGEVIFGATQNGTRDFLSWLHKLYEENLINFENMQNRYTDPFGELTATASANGSTGYMFSNQPFGGNYSVMAADQFGDTECNWWPVQDVGVESGQELPFYEETTLVDATATIIAVSSQCDNVELALNFLDYGYSYEGALLYNYGFQKGSGHDVETWEFDENGEPVFDAAVLKSVAEATNIASSIVSTKDLAGIVCDTRLSFEFGERELACFEAWSTNKNTSQMLGSITQLTAEEGIEAAGIYSDILTYVSTSALQFINGDLDVDDDAVWEEYVTQIENMNVDGLSEVIQGAYDRAHG